MWIVIILVLVLVIPIVISDSQRIHQSHRDYSRGIMNHDASFREFVYKVDKTSDEIWSIIKCQNMHTPMKYRFNETDHTITFYSDLPNGSLDITYGVYIFEHEGHTILKVVQQNHLWEKNMYALLQNEFWNRLLDAIPIPYIQQSI